MRKKGLTHTHTCACANAVSGTQSGETHSHGLPAASVTSAAPDAPQPMRSLQSRYHGSGGQGVKCPFGQKKRKKEAEGPGRR